MITAEHKIEVLSALLAYKLIRDKHATTFFKSMIKDKKVLDRIHFTDKKMHAYNYFVNINIKTGKPIIWLNGNVYKDTSLFRALKRVLLETNSVLFIAIETNRPRIKQALSKIDYFSTLIDHVIFEANMDYIVNTYRAEQLKKRIDEALDEKDYDAFVSLTTEYKNIINCT